ncbi:hypothetical protein RFI_17231, partial [Reticulomyxa filosa]
MILNNKSGLMHCLFFFAQVKKQGVLPFEKIQEKNLFWRMANNSEEQREELESLKSIYGDAFECKDNNVGCFRVHLWSNSNETASKTKQGPKQKHIEVGVEVKVEFTNGYPQTMPKIEIKPSKKMLRSVQQHYRSSDDETTQQIAQSHLKDIPPLVKSVMEQHLNTSMLFQVLDAIQSFLNHYDHQADQTTPTLSTSAKQGNPSSNSDSTKEEKQVGEGEKKKRYN